MQLTKKTRASGNGKKVPAEGGGAMGELMRQKDWTTTPLGSPDRWSPNLKGVLRVVLESPCAMWIGWGEDLTFFYNDACRAWLAEKHPQALGASTREVWSDLWQEVGPRIQHVLERGKSTSHDGLRFPVAQGRRENVSCGTFSYSPLYQESDQLAGLLCVVTNTEGSGGPRDELFAFFTHELRNAIAPIRNSLHIIELSGAMTPAQQRAHEVIEKQTTQIVQLVELLVDRERLDREQSAPGAGAVADALITAMQGDKMDRDHNG